LATPWADVLQLPEFGGSGDHQSICIQWPNCVDTTTVWRRVKLLYAQTVNSGDTISKNKDVIPLDLGETDEEDKFDNLLDNLIDDEEDIDEDEE
jgi:hypothetical protein